MTEAIVGREQVQSGDLNPRRTSLLLTLLALSIFATFTGPRTLNAQTATIASSWWTYQQDCSGDGCKAGNLPGDMARLNWSPIVDGCNGTLDVFEVLYYKACTETTWTAFFTNPVHSITGCRSLGDQFLDIPMDSNCGCWDYKIELYRSGETVPDDIHSNANDPTLSQHKEKLLSQDICLSDNFVTAVALSATAGSYSDDNQYATKEAGEPNHAGNAACKSLWYTWTAPTNKPVTFDTLGSTFDTVLAVYTGNVISNLTPVVSNDDIAGWTNRQSRVTFTPVSGETYHIAVDGFGGASGILILNWNQTGAALPDLIIYGPAAAPTIVTRTFSSNDCEVVEGCEPEGERTLLSFTTQTQNIGNGDLVMGDPATNAWFYWATCHQHWHFEQFAAYNLLDTSNNIVATGHKVGFCLEDVVAVPGTVTPAKYTCSYQGIQRGWADVYQAGLPCQYIDITGVPPGSYVLQMIVNPDNLIEESNTGNNETRVPVTIPPAGCISAPANDNFDNGLVITQTPFSYTEFNNCATKEIDEPDHADDPGGHSVWFTWTPGSNRTVVVTTQNSDFDTLLAVYTGNSVSALNLVASNDDIIQDTYIQSSLSFEAQAGVTYHIAVDGWGGAVGTVVLNLDPPVNDDFANPTTLTGTRGTTNGSNLAASKESYGTDNSAVHERAHAGDVGGHSVWYEWVAPKSGPVDFNTVGSTFNTTLAVYTGTVMTNLTPIASNIDDTEGSGLASRVDFYATDGTAYRIAIDGFGGVVGNYRLNWNMDSELAIERLPNGNVDISLTGVDWQRYTLLGSSNLHSWATNYPTITMSGGIRHYTNSPATNNFYGRSQFYRAFRSP
jgi:hypothetical protein